MGEATGAQNEPSKRSSSPKGAEESWGLVNRNRGAALSMESFSFCRVADCRGRRGGSRDSNGKSKLLGEKNCELTWVLQTLISAHCTLEIGNCCEQLNPWLWNLLLRSQCSQTTWAEEIWGNQEHKQNYESLSWMRKAIKFRLRLGLECAEEGLWIDSVWQQAWEGRKAASKRGPTALQRDTCAVWARTGLLMPLTELAAGNQCGDYKVGHSGWLNRRRKNPPSSVIGREVSNTHLCWLRERGPGWRVKQHYKGRANPVRSRVKCQLTGGWWTFDGLWRAGPRAEQRKIIPCRIFLPSKFLVQGAWIRKAH